MAATAFSGILTSDVTGSALRGTAFGGSSAAFGAAAAGGLAETGALVAALASKAEPVVTVRGVGTDFILELLALAAEAFGITFLSGTLTPETGVFALPPETFAVFADVFLGVVTIVPSSAI
ncbi:MAG: hypothetical protein ABID63_04100 [Pseudomonadota bacterium]